MKFFIGNFIFFWCIFEAASSNPASTGKLACNNIKCAPFWGSDNKYYSDQRSLTHGLCRTPNKAVVEIVAHPLSPCANNPCSNANNTRCAVGENNSYICICDEGYIPITNNTEKDGCQKIPCDAYPCTNGHCGIGPYGSYTCICNDGFNHVSSCSSPLGICERDVQCIPCVWSGHSSTYDECYISEPGMILSPNYPNEYDEDGCLSWTIRGRECEKIHFSIEDIDIGSDDVVFIYDGDSYRSPSVRQLRASDNNTTYVFTSTNNAVLIAFVSKFNPGKGFKITYKQIPI